MITWESHAQAETSVVNVFQGGRVQVTVGTSWCVQVQAQWFRHTARWCWEKLHPGVCTGGAAGGAGTQSQPFEQTNAAAQHTTCHLQIQIPRSIF